jgi:hypothetical protein
MKRTARAWIARIDRLNPRDRMALAAGLLAAVVGVEAMVMLPMRDKRQRIEQSVQSDTALQAAEQATLQADQARRLAELQADTSTQQAKLATLGLKNTAQHDTLASVLSHSLQHQGVALTALKGLQVEAIPVLAPSAQVADAAVVAEPTAPATLFRHRVEVRIEGPVPSLTRALDLLEHQLMPLRIERVLVTPADAAGVTAQATVVLTTISQERTWLAL